MLTTTTPPTSIPFVMFQLIENLFTHYPGQMDGIASMEQNPFCSQIDGCWQLEIVLKEIAGEMSKTEDPGSENDTRI